MYECLGPLRQKIMESIPSLNFRINPYLNIKSLEPQISGGQREEGHGVSTMFKENIIKLTCCAIIKMPASSVQDRQSLFEY